MNDSIENVRRLHAEGKIPESMEMLNRMRRSKRVRITKNSPRPPEPKTILVTIPEGFK